MGKLTRPRYRTQTVIFSKNAVVALRDGCLCLMFRVGDLGKSHLVQASVRATLIRSEKTDEGEPLNQYATELTVSADDCDADVFFIWPMIIVHKIDEDSPFYSMSADDIAKEDFEIVAILEGTVESTEQSVQARSSYLNNEILWGRRFAQILDYNKKLQGYEINYSKFDNTVAVNTPTCSAEDYEEGNYEENETEGKLEALMDSGMLKVLH